MGRNLAGAILKKVSNIRFDNYIKDSIINRMWLDGGHNIDSLDNYVIGYSAPLFSPNGGVKI